MKLRIQQHVVSGDVLLVSGFIDRKNNAFSDFEVRVESLVEFIRNSHPAYLLTFSSDEAMDIEEESYHTPIFNEEKMLEELDHGILAEYILESNLMGV